MSEAVAVENNVVEQIVPTDATTSGDFGADALSMEQELIDKMSEPEVKAEETPVEPVKPEEGVKAETPVSTPTPVVQEDVAVEINKSLSFKAGVAPTVDQIKALEKEFQRAGFREADYTQKTQEVAAIRKEAEEVLQAQQQVIEDPRYLRQYFEDKHILSAFSPKEMLNYGLAAAKVSPQVWNQFLEWHKEAGYPSEGAPQANPFLEQFTSLEQRISKQDQMLQQFQQEREERAAMDVQNRQKEAYDKEMNRIDGEMKATLAEFPDVKERRLIVEMAASDGTKSWKEVAKSIHDEAEVAKNAWIERKQETKLNTSKPAKGQPVNIVQRQPKTWDEADTLIDQVYGGRPNLR